MNAQEFNQRYVVKRIGTQSYKWDIMPEKYGKEGLLPMWVADMDFQAPEAVQTALAARSLHGAFGYSFVSDDYYEAMNHWHETRHKVRFEKENIRFTPGIVSALFRLLQIFTNEGDAVLIQTPVYHQFMRVINETKRNMICSPLINEHGVYSIDLTRFEDDIVKNEVKAFILCSPHNPVGRVWTHDELADMFAVCKRHNVLVLADEIHQDLILDVHPQIPAYTVSGGAYNEHIITLNSASKSFNLAALEHAQVIFPNEQMRNCYDEAANCWGFGSTNIMAWIATEAAYRDGAAWMEGLLNLLHYNDALVRKVLSEAAPNAIVSPLEGTYLQWIDLSAYPVSDDMERFMVKRCGIACNYGAEFSEENKHFIRLNLATSIEQVQQTADNLAQALRA